MPVQLERTLLGNLIVLEPDPSGSLVVRSGVVHALLDGEVAAKGEPRYQAHLKVCLGEAPPKRVRKRGSWEGMMERNERSRRADKGSQRPTAKR